MSKLSNAEIDQIEDDWRTKLNDLFLSNDAKGVLNLVREVRGLREATLCRCGAASSAHIPDPRGVGGTLHLCSECFRQRLYSVFGLAPSSDAEDR